MKRSFILAGVIILAFLRFAAAQTYEIIELPPPNSNGNSIGFGINEAGIVVGRGFTVSGHYRAVRWDNATPVDLGGLTGYSTSKASGISNFNRIVGQSGASCIPADPTLWEVGQVVALPDVARISVEVYKVSDAGVAVGEAYDSCERPWNNAAFQWHDNWIVSPLIPVSGDPESGAYGVSSSGVVVGFSGDSSGDAHLRACRWVNGVPGLVSDLGGDYSIAFAINDVGQYAGYSRTVGGTFRAYFFNGASAADLGTLPGYAHSNAVGVNNAGTVIGFAFNGTGESTIYPFSFPDPQQRAFVWQNGVMHNAIDLISPNSGWTSLNAALDINERGQITGYGVRGNRYRAFLMNPILAGDMNCDIVVDIADVPLFVDALLATGGFAGCDVNRADINLDTLIDGRDVQYFLSDFVP